MLVLGFTVFGPVVQRELAALERRGVADLDYQRLRGQARLLSWGTIGELVVIVALMVKPG